MIEASDVVAIRFHPLVALAFGTVVGFFAQAIATRLKYNGEWDSISAGKRRALYSTGALSAFAAGLYVLDGQTFPAESPYVYRMWLIQLAAAWGGAAVLDVAAEALKRYLGVYRSGKKAERAEKEGRRREDRER